MRKKTEPDPITYDYLTSYYTELHYAMAIGKLLDDAKIEGMNVNRIIAAVMASAQMVDGITESEILNEKDLFLMDIKG